MSKKYEPTLSQTQALQAWVAFVAERFPKRNWRRMLIAAWDTGDYKRFEFSGYLQQIRNDPARPATWLAKVKVDGYRPASRAVCDETAHYRCEG